MTKPKAEYTVTLNEPPMTQEEISRKYIENLAKSYKQFLQQSAEFYTGLAKQKEEKK